MKKQHVEHEGNVYVLSYDELENQELVKKAIAEGKKLATWSVEDASNNYADDLFTGSLSECAEYAQKFALRFCQIALISIDENCCTDYTYDVQYLWVANIESVDGNVKFKLAINKQDDCFTFMTDVDGERDERFNSYTAALEAIPMLWGGGTWLIDWV